jgi:hypothetical protein
MQLERSTKKIKNQKSQLKLKLRTTNANHASPSVSKNFEPTGNKNHENLSLPVTFQRNFEILKTTFVKNKTKAPNIYSNSAFLFKGSNKYAIYEMQTQTPRKTAFEIGI